MVGITYQTIGRRLLAEMLGDPLGKSTIKPTTVKHLSQLYQYWPPPSVWADTQVKVWMNKHGWTENEEGQIFIFNQEESIKPKNIVEKIDFES